MELDRNEPTDRELRRVTNLRKIDTLRKIPLVKWRKSEILDLIEHYMLYFDKFRNSDNLLSINEFITLGMYKKFYRIEIEELKKD